MGSMNTGMFGMSNNNQVIDRIVGLGPVKMMDSLIRSQLASKVLLHNVTMFKNMFAVDCDLAVAIASPSSFTIGNLVAEIDISISPPALVMRGAQFMAEDFFSAIWDCAKIWGSVFGKAARSILNHSFHVVSSELSITDTVGGMQVINRVNSGKLLPRHGEDNPELSRWYTNGKCNDYRRTSASLITGLSALPAREEIV